MYKVVNKTLQVISVIACAIAVLVFAACPDSPDNTSSLETVATPTANPPAGTYTAAQTVALFCTTPGAVIYYTLNGTTPTVSSALYASPIAINTTTTTTIKAIAVKSGMKGSGILSAVYNIDQTDWETVVAPTADLAEGVHPSAQTVTLSCATPGAAIHYTTDGTTPTASSVLYASPIPINATSTLKAIAVKTGMKDSGILTLVYTINQGTVAAPTANPPGGSYNSTQYVYLSTETPAAAIYYTLNGDEPNTDSILYTDYDYIEVNDTTTIKAIAVKNGMNDSTVMSEIYIFERKITIRYGEYTGQLGAFPDIPLTIPTIGQISLTIENYDDLNNKGLVWDYISGEYVEQDTLSWFSLVSSVPNTSFNDLPANIKNRIITDGITIYLNTTSASKTDLLLTHVHYLRYAFTDQGVPMDKIFVNAPESKFTPVYDGWNWVYLSSYRIGWQLYESKSFFDFYPRGTTELINGIYIAGNPDGKTYTLMYGRAMKVSSIGWETPQWSGQYREGDYYEDVMEMRSPIIGIGLEKAAGGILSLASDDVRVQGVVSTGQSTNIDNFTRYENILKEHGLHPSQGVFLNHSNIQIVLPENVYPEDVPAIESNVAANGMLDFIYLYYNPPKGYITGSDPVMEDSKSRLPKMGPYFRWEGNSQTFINYLTFDGMYLPQGVTTRSIGGVTCNNMNRKGERRTSGDPSSYGTGGMPNADFIGNITVQMANYLRSALGISEFRNTNIVGDGSEWSGATDTAILPDTVNVGLIGDYYNIVILRGRFHGVTDILGRTPEYISQGANPRKGYFNVWSNVLRETRVTKFDIVRVRGTGGGNIVTGSISWGNESRLVVYDKKYTGTVTGAQTLRPNHRAFVIGNIVKLTGGSIPNADATAYQGDDETEPVPSPNEEDWIKFGNGATTGFTSGVTYVNDMPQLAANYAALPSSYKITQSEFDNLPVVE